MGSVAVGSWEEQYDQTATAGLPVPFLFSEPGCLLWTCGQVTRRPGGQVTRRPGGQVTRRPGGQRVWRRPGTDPNPNPTLSPALRVLAVPGLLQAPEGLEEARDRP
ncbi:unnamed protein product [Gadus morhua 'NCC']